MENVMPRYVRPVAKIDDPVNKTEFWNEAIDAFDEKKYKQTVIAILNYINPSLLEGKDTESDIEITKMQGSAELQVKVTDSLFSVKAPFLKITPETHKIPLLRKVAELNFTPLMLAQIHQKDNELWFEYEMPLDLSYPHKVYDILHNVAVYSDDFDDMFIENYKASFYKTPAYKQLTEKEKQEVWKQISDIFEDYKNYTEFFREKRWDDFIWDIIALSLLKISNMPYVHGKLRSDLIEEISRLFNGDIDYNYRMEKGTAYMNKLVNTPKEEILKNIYHADTFISLRWRSNPQIITDRLKHYVEQVEKNRKNEYCFNQAYYLQVAFLKLIYDFNLEENYKQAIYDVLEKVSGLEPDKAAPELLEVFYAMHEGRINQQKTKENKKGFFAQLFK